MECKTALEKEMRNALEWTAENDYEFQGRKVETDKFRDLLYKKRIIWLHGMPKVGKSALVFNCLKSYSEKDVCLLYINFEQNENLEVHLRNQLDIDSKTEIGTRDLTKAFYKQVNDSNKPTLLVLDNADKDDLQTYNLQTFINDGFRRCRNLKFIVTSTHKMSFIKKGFASLEIGPLEDESLKALLQEVVDQSMTEEDMVFIDALIVLCQGLPLAALYIGTEMNESEGLFTPSDMLELLLLNRFKALTSEYYPMEDRPSEQCEKMFLQLNSAFKDMFMSLTPKVSNSSFTVEDAVDATGDEQASNATVKRDLIQPMARKSVVSLSSYQKDEFIKVHSLLLECIAINKDTRDNTQEATRLALERAKEVGIDISEEEIKNPRKLAALIASMKDVRPKKEKDSSSDSDDSGTVDDLSDDSDKSGSSSRKSSDTDCIRLLQTMEVSNPPTGNPTSLSSLSGPMALSYQGEGNLTHLDIGMSSNQSDTGAFCNRPKVKRNDSTESNDLNKLSSGSRSPSPDHGLDLKGMNISGSMICHISGHKSHNCMTSNDSASSEKHDSAASAESNVRNWRSFSPREEHSMPRGPPSGRYTPPAGQDELPAGRRSPDRQAVEHSENFAKCNESKKSKKQAEEKKLNI